LPYSTAQPVWKLPKKPRKKRRRNIKSDETQTTNEIPINPVDQVNPPDVVKPIEAIAPEAEVEVVEHEVEPNVEQETEEHHFKVQNSDFLNVQVIS